VIEVARAVLGAIDLDPASCAEANETVRAAAFYTPRHDGLRRPWFGRVWLNPPYGKHVAGWVDKLLADHGRGAVTAALALLPARVDTRWFARLDGYPRCFIAGRLRFSDADAAPADRCMDVSWMQWPSSPLDGRALARGPANDAIDDVLLA
jgi:ParB family chromosome partitioning protein